MAYLIVVFLCTMLVTHAADSSAASAQDPFNWLATCFERDDEITFGEPNVYCPVFAALQYVCETKTEDPMILGVAGIVSANVCYADQVAQVARNTRTFFSQIHPGLGPYRTYEMILKERVLAGLQGKVAIKLTFFKLDQQPPMILNTLEPVDCIRPDEVLDEPKDTDQVYSMCVLRLHTEQFKQMQRRLLPRLSK